MTKLTYLLISLSALIALPGCGLIQKKPENTHTKAPVNVDAPAPTLAELLEENCYLDANLDQAPSEWRTLDLWDRVRHGFTLEHVDSKAVTQQRNWFAKHPEYIDRVVNRGERYLHYIVGELEKRNMPMELALLPVVESAFDPFAYSPSRASGMWQIVPGTGKMLGLKQTWWYDGRRDAVASTDAALNYLQYLHKRFNQDWLLALAAYNSGEGKVSRAIKKNKKKGLKADYWHLDLPRETRRYVPKLLALAQVIQSPSSYGLRLKTLPDAPFFSAVNVGAQIDLAQAAMLAEVDIDVLYELNPGFNRWATDPDGPHRILVPTKQKATFENGLTKLPASQRVKWQRHTIKTGETLSHIAKRYNLTVASLKSINRINGHTIRAGKTLMVPIAQKGASHYVHSTAQRLARKQEAGNKSGSQRITHTVASGDSFWAIGKSYGISARQIAKWNNMAPKDTLKVGQKLVLWLPSDTVSKISGRTAAFNDSAKEIRKLSYKVRQGDSLYKIASKFHVAVADIVKWNRINTKRYLQPGQSLVLFVNVKS